MFHRLPKAAAGMALVLVLAGCSSSATPSPVVTPAPATPAPATPAPATPAPGTPAPATPAPCAGTFTGSVVVIPKQMNNAYFDIAYKGIQDAACALGGTVTEVGPSTADATLQIPFIQTAITQHAKAIIVSADGADAVAPALKQAMAAGIKVVGVDSSPAVGAYNVFVNQADTAGVGKGLADMACDEAPSCTGEVAVLSAAQTATNQNAWIAAMQTTLKDAKYSKLVFDGVYYGNDDPQISTTQAQAMLAAHPNLKVIIAPTTVGIVAAAQVVTSQNLVGKVFVGGLGFPKAMQTFVKSGVAPEFGLWNVSDLGYLAYATAVGLVNGTIKGTAGETYSVPSYATLNGGQPYTIGQDNIVVLGPVFMFTPANIDAMAALFGM
jgi:rhamnose transport system substrate-binding protein